MNYSIREYYIRYRDRFCQWIAWHIPVRIAMWTYVRVGAHATTGKHGNTVVPEITMMDALGRWTSDNRL